MSRHGFLFQFACLVLFLFVQGPAKALPLQCEKAVISGEADWPPFSYMSEGRLNGAGIELAKLLFHELNIPVEVKYFHHTRDLEHALESGDVDVIVSTYDLPRYEKSVQLVLPHYYQDSLGIIVPSGNLMPFAHWDDLIGRIGITPANEQLGREFKDYAQKNLNIISEGNLRYAIRKLKAGDYEYIIGSAQLLTAGVNWYGQGEVEFLPMLVSAEDVYMGFSSASECKNYKAYFRKRLAELRDSEIVSKLVTAHTSPKQTDQTPSNPSI